jgi:prophage regulatory protein
MVQRFLRLAEVEKATGLSRPSIYRLVAEGTFPKPVKTGDGSARATASAWLETEIEEWQQRRIAKRDDGTVAKRRRRRAA